MLAVVYTRMTRGGGKFTIDPEVDNCVITWEKFLDFKKIDIVKKKMGKRAGADLYLKLRIL